MFHINDKVSLRFSTEYPSSRGVVKGFKLGKVLVLIDGLTTPLPFPENALRNYSLSARKAWKTMKNENDDPSVYLKRDMLMEYYACGKLEYLVSRSHTSTEADILAFVYFEDHYHNRLPTPENIRNHPKINMKIEEAYLYLDKYLSLSLEFLLNRELINSNLQVDF